MNLSAAALCLTGAICIMDARGAPALQPVVEAQYQVYETGNANNGSGPMWCYGSTCLVRLGKEAFASGLDLIPGAKPLNNVRWTLFNLGDEGSKLLQADLAGRQREPCPMGVFDDGRLLLTSNPTLNHPPEKEGGGPAQPVLLRFDAKKPAMPPQVSLPVWEGKPKFTEHSYRAFCVDGKNHEALYLQNVGYDTSYWSFLDRGGEWSKCGSIKMPWGAEFEKPEAIRVCYQNTALRDRAAYILGVSDIIEWVREWREYKLVLHKGKTWDYDFRRLYFCWTADIAAQPFSEWVKVAECPHCGHITNLDLHIDDQQRAHILWLEQSIWDPRVRDKFFPGEPITYALMYWIIAKGQAVQKTRLVFGGEQQANQEQPGYARFQVTPDGRLFVFYYTSGADEKGRRFAENRLMEIYPGGSHSDPVRVPLKHPMTSFFTATERGGSARSATLDLLGPSNTMPGILYARINLLNTLARP